MADPTASAALNAVAVAGGLALILPSIGEARGAVPGDAHFATHLRRNELIYAFTVLGLSAAAGGKRAFLGSLVIVAVVLVALELSYRQPPPPKPA